jgi:glycosyl transferase family 11
MNIPLQGGLGNQLFQLAAGLVVEQRLGKAVTYSDHWLRNPAPGETPRTFALQGLLRPGELVSSATDRAGHVTDRILNHRVVERSSDDDALGRVGRHTRVLVGYLQRLDYAEDAWPALRDRLASSSDAGHRRLVQPDDAPYGALHYRLGDYRSNPTANAMHGVTSPEYFAEVIRSKTALTGITDWLVVSDDPATALELLRSAELPTGATLRTVESSGEWQDLGLLAAARVCAISNSSFSWWAAFLGRRSRDMQVVAPRPWFLDGTDAEPHLFPVDWERLDRSVLPAHGG